LSVTPLPEAPTSDSERRAEPFAQAMNCRPPKLLKLTSTKGVPVKPGAVVPSMLTWPAIVGKALVSVIVLATPNLMASAPGLLFAFRID
jgi:hypothetical protein